MAQNIIIKRSTTTALTPGVSTLNFGIQAFTNIAGAKRMYIGDSNNVAQEIAGDAYALLASPAFTGTPTAPTASFGTNTTQIASTAFVQAAVEAAAQGLVNKGTVRASTTTALPSCTYDNGASGVGATLTGDANGALSAQDGVTLVEGDLLLVQDEVDQTTNGIYELTQVGDAGTPFILTRTTNFDSSSTIVPNSLVFVSEGSTRGDTAWWVANLAQPFVVGTNNIVWSPFSAAVYTAGDAINITGSTINVKYDNTSIGVNGSNQLYIKAEGVGPNELSTSVAGIALDGGDGSALNVRYDDATIGVNGSNLLFVKNAGITETQIASSSLSSTGGLTGGNGTKLAIAPDNTTGATVVPIALSANGAGITVDNSSLENNAGTARVKALGITNAMLAGSIADSKLSQITTANKVAGSAVQLNASGAIINSTGLAVQVDGSTIDINGSNQVEVKTDGITATQLASNSVTSAKIATSAIGNGLTGGGGSAVAALADTTTSSSTVANSVNVSSNGLAVKIDGSSITQNGSNQLQVETVDGGTF